MKIRKNPPKPELVVNIDLGVYAWKCECKHLKVWGNSAEDAVTKWKEARKFELELLTTN